MPLASIPDSCRLCGAPSPKKIRSVTTDREYDLYACASCDAWFWWPMENPGARWYEHDERYRGRNKDPLLEPTWNHRKIISFLAPKTGRVLDVGCGTGNFLAHAHARGWDAYGIDFDRDAVEVAHTVFKLPQVEASDIASYAAAHPGQTFDLVTFFDVFEHLDNHAEFFKHVRSLLADGGHIAMSLPYRHHAFWLNSGDVPPRHLSAWDRSALTKFLERNGFTVEYIARRSEGIRHLIVKLRFGMKEKLSFGFVDATKRLVRKNNEIRVGSKTERIVWLAASLAKIKDAVFFGIPALVIWLWMLPSRRRYITLYCIARKNQ